MATSSRQPRHSSLIYKGSNGKQNLNAMPQSDPFCIAPAGKLETLQVMSIAVTHYLVMKRKVKSVIHLETVKVRVSLVQLVSVGTVEVVRKRLDNNSDNQPPLPHFDFRSAKDLFSKVMGKVQITFGNVPLLVRRLETIQGVPSLVFPDRHSPPCRESKKQSYNENNFNPF